MKFKSLIAFVLSVPLILAAQQSTSGTVIRQNSLPTDRIVNQAPGTILGSTTQAGTVNSLELSNGASISGNKLSLSANNSEIENFVIPERLPISDSDIAGTVSPYLVLDQFGYLPAAPKFLIIRNPIVGHDAAESYSITGKTYKAVNLKTKVETTLPAPVAFNSGATDADSGDAGWHLNFSTLTTPGDYIITDGTVRTYRFTVSTKVIQPQIRAALRMLYYQRIGIDKTSQYSDVTLAGTRPWVDGDWGIPYRTARNVNDPNNAATEKNLDRGWADAGDSTKYLTYGVQTVHALLSAFDIRPAAFSYENGGDSYNIPESGNGTPDILDEVKWEVDLFENMCDINGSCIIHAGYRDLNGDYALPRSRPTSANPAARYYDGIDCSNANIAAASAFAHAAATFKRSNSSINVRDRTYIDRLTTRAVNGYNRWTQQKAGTLPGYTNNCDNQTVKFGDADFPFWNSDSSQTTSAVFTAIFLYELTGNSVYRTYAETNYAQAQFMRFGGYTGSYPEESMIYNYFTTMPGVSTTVINGIRNAITGFLTSGGGANLGGNDTTSLYRNRIKDFVYASNNERVAVAIANVYPKLYSGYSISSQAQYKNRSLETIHYINGANPFNIAYWSNMVGPPYYLGKSTDQMYHFFAIDGNPRFDRYNPLNITASPGPMPGYMMAGPTGDATLFSSPNAIQCTVSGQCLSPPYASTTNTDITAQPREKRWAPENRNDFPGNIWYITTEATIYWNAQLIYLLSAFATEY